MDNQQKSMEQKRQRHYNETKTVIAVSFIIFGVVSMFCLLVMWPQVLSINVFNSRLAYRLILDVEDYWSCNKDYVNFVIDEPPTSTAMHIFYVFNVTNTADVLQRGYKPRVVETGPYGFAKHTYKYDILFDSVDSLNVSFKEYTLLKDVESADDCEAMFYRLDRDDLIDGPCPGSTCKCQDLNSAVVTINPLNLKVLWEDTPSDMLAYYSMDVFREIQTILDKPFTEAVHAHLVSEGLKEVYLFRLQMQSGHIMNTAFSTLLQSYTVEEIATTRINPTTCGLSIYGIQGCPFTPFAFVEQSIRLQNDIDRSDYPSLLPLFNTSSEFSFLNMDAGLPKWLGISWFLDLVEFNSADGYTMVNNVEIKGIYDSMTTFLAEAQFGVGNVTSDQKLGSQRVVFAVSEFISNRFIFENSIRTSRLQVLTYEEWVSTSEEVPCDPRGTPCIWQWGFIENRDNPPFEISYALSTELIDVQTEISTNPSNLYKDTNGPAWYNTFLYCSEVLNAPVDFDISCTNLAFTIFDATVSRPAGLWGVDNGISTVNSTFLHLEFQRQSKEVQQYYGNFACNISHLTQNVYRRESDFHDEFIVRFLNKNKDPLFAHNFTVGNWTELGLAQWGGGFVTHALASVRTTNQMVRDGMWRIGEEKFYENFLEYSSWAIIQGYPQAWFYTVEEARMLLNALVRRDQVGIDFRRHIVYRGTTFIGDGVNYQNSVGEIGEVTFTREANLGNFSCTGDLEEECRLLDVFYTSSAGFCQDVQDLFEICTEQYTSTLINNKWIDIDNCANFETSSTSPTLGVQCDSEFIYGNPHPYTKSVGNIIFQMLYSLTLETELKGGLWCEQILGCDFSWGGMFATTTVNKLLFQGYTEPSILKYLSLKHENINVTFECIDNAFDQCGVQIHNCYGGGIFMNLPEGKRKRLEYNNTINEEFFSPYFVVTTTGDLLWPFARNLTLAVESRKLMINPNEFSIVRNPHWSAYPAWNSDDTDFIKYFQCQKRTLGGPPHLFLSCIDTLATGRDVVENTQKLLTFYGNETVFPFSEGFDVEGATESQHPMYFWSGFNTYPYAYLGLEAGENHFTLSNPEVFSKINSVLLTLSQDSLLFGFQRDISVQTPLDTGPIKQSAPVTQQLPTRRFVEDENTWDKLRFLGTPNDSYGMSYQVPIGMSSLTRLSNFPVYIETPHSYGNEKWGGLEYTFVLGTVQEENSQRTFIDYDPVTGKALRTAIRQQVTLRVEAGPLFPLAFSSQQRCTPPSKTFAQSSGYGCFAYVPIFWFEESRTLGSEQFFQFYDHFYTRPDRANVLSTAGIVIGALFILLGTFLYINEAYHRRKFNKRIYVD